MRIDPPAAAELVRLLNDDHPQRTYLGIRTEDDVPSGWETHLLGLVATFEEHGEVRREALVLRCHDGPEADQKAEHERRIMHRVAERGIPVPRVRARLLRGSPLPYPCLMLERVAGVTAQEQLDGATAEEIRGVLPRLLEPLVRLHQLSWPSVLPEGSGEVGPRAKFQSLQAAAARPELQEFRPVLEWMRARQPQDLEPRLALCHNDYHPQNLLLRSPQAVPVVLDWSFARVDDWRLDLAWSVLLFGTMLGRQFRNDVLGAYQSLSGGEIGNFDFFEALKLTDRMLTLATWLLGVVDIPVPRITPKEMRGDYRVHVLNVYQRLVELTGVRLPIFEAL